MFNPYAIQYQQRLNQLEAQQNMFQPQPMHNMPNTNQQSVCYFVNSKDDLQNIQPTPGILYIGVNKQTKEIYTRAWNNNGLIDFDTYSLSKGEQETSELKTILDKLNVIENKMQEMTNERNRTNVNATSNAGTNEKQPYDGNVQSNDAR